MFESKLDFIKTSFFYFLKIELLLFTYVYLCSPLLLAVFLFLPQIQGSVYTYLANGICGVIVELLMIFLIFYFDFCNNKKIELKPIFLSLVTALVLQFAVASINYFYHYTAGMGITYISEFFYAKITGDVPLTPNYLPIYYYIIATFAMDILRISAVLGAFALAKSKHKKERKEILGTKQNET